MPQATKTNAFLRNDSKTISQIWNDTVQLDALETNAKAALFVLGLPLLANKGLSTLIEKTEAGSKLQEDGYVDIFLHDSETSKAFIAGIQSVWDRPKKTPISTAVNNPILDFDQMIDLLRDESGNIRSFSKAIKSLDVMSKVLFDKIVVKLMADLQLNRAKTLTHIRENVLQKADNKQVQDLMDSLGL